jgi:hypothetical protein
MRRKFFATLFSLLSKNHITSLSLCLCVCVCVCVCVRACACMCVGPPLITFGQIGGFS